MQLTDPLTHDEVTMQFTVDGVEREALVFVPTPILRAVKFPLVFAFHGHGGDMKATAQRMGIQDLWQQAIVVYPQGKPRKSPVDPTGHTAGWQVEANQSGGVGN